MEMKRRMIRIEYGSHLNGSMESGEERQRDACHPAGAEQEAGDRDGEEAIRLFAASRQGRR